jgi:hypothetical protein
MRRFPWLAALASLAAAGDALNEEWVSKDVAVARRVAEALPAGKIEDFLAKLDASATEEDRDIGFGARRLRLALYGGYTTTWVTVVSWGAGAGPLEAWCHEGDAGIWAALKDRIAAEYGGKAPAVGRTGLRLRVGHPADPEGFRAERARVLGPPAGIDPAPAVADAYALLWSPLSDLAYGHMQGEGGDKPEGRVAMEKLLLHEQGASLLEDVLRGPNPEGRLYAAEGLLRLERKGRKPDERARAAIEWVRTSAVKVHVCRGCEMSWEPAAKPLEEMLRE